MTNIKLTTVLCAAVLAAGVSFATPSTANAGYPVYYAPAQPVVPAVVGYSARRAGLFGRRVVVRPVVAPVAAAPVVVARPVVTTGYSVAPPVAAYYPPPASVVVPVQTYRVTYDAFIPGW